MASLNRVQLIGRAGSEPETRYMANGDAVCNLRFATTETWKDKATGEKRENTEWHRLVFYRRLAEVASQYVAKGAQLFIEGRLRTRKWQDKDGQDRYTTEIEVTEMQMLGSRQGGDKAADEPRNSGAAGDGGGGGGNAPAPRRQPDYAPAGEDIPFVQCHLHSDPVFLKATAPIRRTA